MSLSTPIPHGSSWSRASGLWHLIRAAGESWVDDKAQRLGAALAFYAAFSMAPLLVIALGIAGLVFPRDAVRKHLLGELSYFLGDRGAEGVRDLLDAAQVSEQGLVATVIGLITLLIGASGAFGQLQAALNTIWQVKPKRDRAILTILRDRFVSFTLVLGTGFLLTVSLIVSTALSALGTWMGALLRLPESVLQWTQVVGSTLVFGLLFALIFKFVPDAKVRWKDVWIGALMTALLFVLGKYLIGIYLGRAAVVSAYGAAASFAIVLLWLYYSSLILFLGAELTYAHALMCGSRVKPTENAQPVSRGERSQEGLSNRELAVPRTAL